MLKFNENLRQNSLRNRIGEERLFGLWSALYTTHNSETPKSNWQLDPMSMIGRSDKVCTHVKVTYQATAPLQKRHRCTPPHTAIIILLITAKTRGPYKYTGTSQYDNRADSRERTRMKPNLSGKV